ncbi:MAG TPA: hypothetical protein VG937_11015 [Polyangiaceae bacterium]|nr:hypothetical protein [Polyangiaceae bacterium]
MDPIRSNPAVASYDTNEIIDPWKDSEPKPKAAPPPKLDPLLVDPWSKDFEAKWGKRIGPFDDPWSDRPTPAMKLDPQLIDPWKRP